MEETKKLKIAPSEEERVTQLMQDFGWSLVSSQEIKNTDSHLERKGDTIYNVTTTENYINLLFRRDTAMPNYNRIVDCENQYYAVPDNQPVSARGRTIAIIASLFFLIMMIVGFSNGAPGFAIPCLVFFLILVGVSVLATRSGMKTNAGIRSQNAQNDQKRTELRQKSRSLL